MLRWRDDQLNAQRQHAHGDRVLRQRLGAESSPDHRMVNALGQKPQHVVSQYPYPKRGDPPERVARHPTPGAPRHAQPQEQGCYADRHDLLCDERPYPGIAESCRNAGDCAARRGQR